MSENESRKKNMDDLTKPERFILVTSELHTVMILSFWTDRSGQTVQTQITLLLKEQFEKGLHCLHPWRFWDRSDPIVCNSHCIFWTHYSTVKPLSSNFRVITAAFSGVWIFWIFMVPLIAGEIYCVLSLISLGNLCIEYCKHIKQNSAAIIWASSWDYGTFHPS